MFLAVLFAVGIAGCPAAGAATPAQLERSEELLRQEEALRARINRTGMVYIKDIRIEGAARLAKDELETITFAYKRRWLTAAEIDSVVGMCVARVRERFAPRQFAVSREIKRHILIIRFQE